MGKFVILGAVGNCLDIADAWQAARSMARSDSELIGYLDDRQLPGTLVAGIPVLGPLSQARALGDVQFICGIGGPRSFRTKPEILAGLGLPRDRFLSVVHPAAVVSPSAVIGRGSCILANSTVCANAVIGDHVMVLPGCVIGHDSKVEDHAILAAGVIVSGNVIVGRNCYLGAGSIVRDGVKVGAGALVGLGAGVVGEIAGNAVAIGLPARDRGYSA